MSGLFFLLVSICDILGPIIFTTGQFVLSDNASD
jgi:hypothetical protein